MTTVDLLRETLARDADVAARPDRIDAVRARVLGSAGVRTDGPALVVVVPPPPAARRRYRPLGLGMAALATTAVAALVVAVFVAGGSGGGAGPAAVAPAGALPVSDYGFSVAPDPGGLPFSYAGTAAGVQGGFWRRPGADLAAAAITVATSPAAGQIPTRPADATPVTVAGRAGWSAPWDDTMGLYFAIGATGTLTVWQDGSGLWAALITIGADPARTAQLAATVELADYHPVRVPLTLRWLPPGSDLTAVSSGDDGSTQLVFGAHGSQFVLGVGPAGTTRGDGGGTSTAPPRQLVIGSIHGQYRADDPMTVLTDGRVDLVVGAGEGAASTAGAHPSAMPLDTLTRLVGGITVADLGDPAGWTDVAAALPS